MAWPAAAPPIIHEMVKEFADKNETNASVRLQD